jgi:hypothetical protein
MDPLGIAAWLVAGLALAGATVATMQYRERAAAARDALYVVPAALLGTYMGSEAFKEPWRFIGSEKGPELDGFFVVTGLIFGLVVAVLGGLSARAPAPEHLEA